MKTHRVLVGYHLLPFWQERNQQSSRQNLLRPTVVVANSVSGKSSTSSGSFLASTIGWSSAFEANRERLPAEYKPFWK